MAEILVRKIYIEQIDKRGWALVNKSGHIFKWFGATKPSKKKIEAEKKLFQQSIEHIENIISELHSMSDVLRKKGMVHIADAVTNCIVSIVKKLSQNENALRLNKIISILHSKGEMEIAERLDNLLPDIIACNYITLDFIEIENKVLNVRISALRAYNIAKMLKTKYLTGELDATDFEYKKMKELEALLKDGFLMPLPYNYNSIPGDALNWWDHFEKLKK